MTYFHKVSDLFHSVYEEIENRQAKYKNTWLTQLNNMTDCLKPGMLSIVAGRPKMGTTSLALTIAKNLTIERKKVIYISLTAEPMELTLRLLSAISSIELTKIQSGNLTEDDWKHISEAKEIISKTDLHIGNLSDSIQKPMFMEMLYSECYALKPFDLLIVDDASLIDSQSLWHDLKSLATVLSVAVIAIPKVHTIGHRVLLEDNIHQEANSITYLNRRDKDAELYIMPSKSDEQLAIYLTYDKKLATFIDKEKESELDVSDVPF